MWQVMAGVSPVVVWRNRDFMILWVGQALSSLGSSMSVLVFPLIGYAITHSAAQAGIATTGVLLGRIIFRLPAGAMVDRWSRRTVLLTSNLAGCVLYGSLGLAAVTHHLSIAHLIVVGFLSGVCDSFHEPASSAAVRTVVPVADLPVAISQLQARDHAADLAGPPLGGALYSIARGLPFLVDAASYLVAAIFLVFLRTPLPSPARGEQRSIRADVAEGMRFVWQQPTIRAIMLGSAILNFTVTTVAVTVTLRLIRAGVHPVAIGLVDTCAAAAGLAGAFLAPALVQRYPTGRTTAATYIVLALIVAPMAWTTNVFAIGALFAGGYLLLPASNSGIRAYLVAVVPDHLQGRVNSAAGLLAYGLLPFGPGAAGILIAVLGGSTATLVGAAGVLASLLPLWITPEIRRLGRPDEWAQVSPQSG
jgi:MFS family permease